MTTESRSVFIPISEQNQENNNEEVIPPVEFNSKKSSLSKKKQKEMTASNTAPLKSDQLSTADLARKTLSLAPTGYKPDPQRSLYLFSENNLIRKTARNLIEYKWFEYVVIATIGANCVSLALEVHLPEEDKSDLVRKMAILEPVFLGIFTAECVLKIVALGFMWNHGSYLRSIWNILDFIVVVAGLVMANISSNTSVDLRTFRAIRVLRPLKLVSGIPSLQVVLSSILKAMKPLLQIAFLVLFAIVIFAIIGLELYRGSLHFTCFRNDSVLLDDATKEPCHFSTKSSCDEGYICRPYWDGPFYGIVNFDNIGYAILTVFQCITMEGWTDIMYLMNKATASQLNAIYFVCIIVVGSFFMLNLILGVLSGEFAKERERVEKRRCYLKMREKQRERQFLDGYLNWVEVGEEIILAEGYIGAAKNGGRICCLPKKKNKDKNDSIVDKNELKNNNTEAGNDIEEEENSACCGEFATFLCCGTCLREMRLVVRHLIKTEFFYWLVVCIVLLNTICVAMEHYNQPRFLNVFLYYTDFVFLTMFLMEMLLKFFGLGFKEYFRSKFNVFDFIVVLLSAFEVIFQMFSNENSFGFSALRCVRLLRLLKLTRYWPSLRNLVFSLLSSVRSILSLLMLLGLFIFILTLLGMQLFGGDFNFDSGLPTLNFDTFRHALITVFVILTGENWNEIMYDGIRSQRKTESPDDASMIFSAYFLFIVLFGNYTLLNVFLAIAVDNLANAAELSAAEEEENQKKVKKRQEDSEEIQKLLGGPVMVPELNVYGEPEEEIDPLTMEKPMTLREELSQTCGITLEEDVEIEMDESVLGKKILPYSSLFILSPGNYFRKLCHFIVNLKYFDLFIMMVIFASSMALAAENPVLADSRKNYYLEWFDNAFTIVFILELSLKVIDMGFVFHPGSYLRDFWNVLDMFVVSVAVSSFLYRHYVVTNSAENNRDLNTIKSLRVLRVLRPLKAINRVPKLKAVFDTIISSLKNVFNILVVFLLFQFIFAVVAVQLFQGKFFYCNDVSKRTESLCKGFFVTYETPGMTALAEKREWKRYCFHYDNILYSMTTLFTVTTGEGWPTVLDHSMFATFQDEGPILDYRPEVFIFYLLFFIVFPFFFVNIFVALIIITFQEQGEKDLTNMDIDKNQKKCIDFAINSKPASTFMPEDIHSLPYKMWLLVLSAPFESFIMILIALNSITLVLKSHTRFPSHTSATSPDIMESIINETKLCLSLKYLNIAFTALFSLECVLKLIAFRFKYYFRDWWNVFDMLTVIGSILDVVMTELKPEDNSSSFANLSFLRLFRALRLVKVLRQGYSIRILLWTFIQSFKSLPWVVLLMALLFFIYCIIGMQVFGNIRLNPDTQINANNNFQTFMMGLLLLFRCATGESWHQIMLDADAGKECEPSSKNDTQIRTDCGNDFSYIYFITFVLFTTFIMLNLFVAVIMDNFDYLTRDSSILGPHHLDEYLRVWACYDPLATGKIHYQDMYKLIRRLDPPLGLGLHCPYRAAYLKLIRMNVVMDKDFQVDFNSTLFALIRESLQIKMGPATEMDNLDQELRVIMMALWPPLKKKIDLYVPQNKSTQPLTVGKVFAGRLILDNWRNYKKWIAAHPNYKEELTVAVRKMRRSSSDMSDESRLVESLGPMSNKSMAMLTPTEYKPRSDSAINRKHNNHPSYWTPPSPLQPDPAERGINLSATFYDGLQNLLERDNIHRSTSPLVASARNTGTTRRRNLANGVILNANQLPPSLALQSPSVVSSRRPSSSNSNDRYYRHPNDREELIPSNGSRGFTNAASRVHSALSNSLSTHRQ